MFTFFIRLILFAIDLKVCVPLLYLVKKEFKLLLNEALDLISLSGLRVSVF